MGGGHGRGRGDGMYVYIYVDSKKMVAFPPYAPVAIAITNSLVIFFLKLIKPNPKKKRACAGECDLDRPPSKKKNPQCLTSICKSEFWKLEFF